MLVGVLCRQQKTGSDIGTYILAKSLYRTPVKALFMRYYSSFTIIIVFICVDILLHYESVGLCHKSVTYRACLMLPSVCVVRVMEWNISQ